MAEAYILQNQITHSRLLPAESAHSFTYATVSLLVSLRALENRKLDLGYGWIFGYGGLWGRLTGLRPDGYLTEQAGSISAKLEGLLRAKGFLSDDEGRLGGVWMMTMPSILGFEGINPLTVYFCYKPDDTLWLTVLEIHNTFSESHVHVLEIGVGEEEPDTGYDHQWTFPREFHVSPFNDRSGFYTISVKSPSHAPNPTSTPLQPPRPAVRVNLYTDSDAKPGTKGPLKLIALLRPTSATPLTSAALLSALARAPFSLFLSFARILYHAWILHYVKRLDVFIRPEPHPATTSWQPSASSSPAGGIKWQPEGLLEQYAHRCVAAFLARRAHDARIAITLTSSNPSTPHQTFSPPPDVKPKDHLTIWYLTPRVFTILLLAPSAQHALLLGSTTERLFFPSSASLFTEVFSCPSHSSSLTPTLRQRFRLRPIPASITLPAPPAHPLDAHAHWLVSTAVVWLLLTLERLEAAVFRLARARAVEGDEPWLQWERAADVFKHGGRLEVKRPAVGSVRRAD